MAATGSEIASAYVALTVKAPGIQKDIAKQMGSVDMPRIGEGMGTKLANGMKRTMKVGGAAVAAVLGTALVKGFGRLKAIETAQAKMRGIGFTSKQVAGAMDNALKSVQGTAFGLGDAASTASQLMAAGIKPGKELEGLLSSVANNAALAGSGFGEMGSIFAKAATQANGVQNDVIGQLADRNIPIYQELGKVLGVTDGEVFKLASQGKINFEQFAQAAEAAAGTAAKEIGGTTTGAFDNMMAALGRLGAKMLQDVYPLIGPLFKDITAGLDRATQKVEPFVSGLGAIGKLLATGDYSAALRDAFGWEEDGKAVGFLLTFRAVLGATIDGIKASVAWVVSNKDWLVPLAVSIGTVVAVTKTASVVTAAWKGTVAAFKAVQMAYAAYTYGMAGATYTYEGASKAGAIATRIFNAALNANPIGIIITAVIALAAGLVWFFTQTKTGKKIWGEFTRFLGEAWANVSGFFKTVWESVLKPVFDGVATVATWVFDNVLKPGFQALQVVFAIFAGIFSGIWESVLKPVFNAIGAVFTWLYENVIGPIILGIKLYVMAWAAIFQWLWTSVLQPVFAALGKVFSWIYETVIVPIVLGIKLYIKALGAVFSWLWKNAVKPAFDGIGVVFTWLFNNIVKPIWNGIKATIAGVWNNGIKPVIDTLVRVIQSDPKRAFEAARDAIGTAWKGIQDLAKKPVKFVIETVINGLIGTVNKILPKGMKIPKVPLPEGFARGGILPGMSRMSDGDDQLIMARRGEGMMVSEALRTPADRSAFLAANAAGRSGVGFASMLQGFARGGLVNPLPKGSYNVSQPYHGGHNGIDLAAAAGTKVYAAADGVVGLAGSVPMGGNEVYIQHANGLGTRYSHLSRFGTSAGTKVKAGNVIGYVGSTGMSTGPHLHYMVHNPGGGPGQYGSHVNPAAYMGISGKDLGEAGGAKSLLDGLVDWAASKIKGAFPDGGMFVDVAAGLAKSAAGKMADAFNPFAAADGSTLLYDNGGWLQPGKHLVENKSGRPEPILTASQWDSLLGAQGGTAGPVRVYIGDREFEGWMDDRADAAVDRGYEDRAAAGRFAAYV